MGEKKGSTNQNFGGKHTQLIVQQRVVHRYSPMDKQTEIRVMHWNLKQTIAS